ncbi:patatin-like phospholipase domain-containing protein 4 [Choloepus didactylus]|uniref:patatin-like phospholipase domain-containing protein 4 n=1 Tax=Choloepus didactylus TaxID=27675 RepID=UPI00189CF633|nr:patatin-like phospholipase domain-containing protein 4 [Choloepus didactylus]
MKQVNLSFAACGFLGIYHLGAASALRRHGRKLLRATQAFAGASAGSLVASVLLTTPEKIEECTEFTYKLAEETRRLSFGAVTPGYDFMAQLRGGMETVLPTNAHELAQNRLHVSITNTKTRKNHLVSHFSSREVLIKVDMWTEVDRRSSEPGGLLASRQLLELRRVTLLNAICSWSIPEQGSIFGPKQTHAQLCSKHLD